MHATPLTALPSRPARPQAAPRTREEVEAEESRFVRRLKESMVAGKPAV